MSMTSVSKEFEGQTWHRPQLTCDLCNSPIEPTQDSLVIKHKFIERDYHMECVVGKTVGDLCPSLLES